MKRWLLAALVVALSVVTLGLSVSATPDVCPEDGKVESQTDGDLDDIVLDAGTQVCIKGGQTKVTVTADGTSTLAELLGTGQNVSHYTVIEEPSTTTTSSTSTTSTSTTSTTSTSTTSTTQPTTTTTAPTTTTTDPSTTTTQPSTTTTEPPTTTTEPPTTTTEPPTTTEETLPFTGPEDMGLLGGAVILLLAGLALVFVGRRSLIE